ncbi:DNA methyltransferase [Dysgonomonas sp. 25]|uniref:DNA methyltransferase n=1 Tax=Dysgonomonas sp. 25 TaxID=2302933 RepID=UPI0013D7A01D|nr:DNA methyltransferase [Dysgonomonas sp. 25]NDV68565.1 site-specific DNA-methyltransferase [Dysgonomonas sp. 25]
MGIYQLGKIKAIRGDCMDYMLALPDNTYDLAIVDPPYGIGEGGKDKNRRRKGEVSRVGYKDSSEWDKSIPDKSYFDELFRVSRNQIIFGANYMVEYLKPSMGWIVWDKGNHADFSDCELLYTSFNRALRKIYVYYMSDYNGKWHLKIHPTQKPIELYKWILGNYATKGDSILDTHGGSFSHAIACHDLDFDLTIIEKDKTYFNDAINRLKTHQQQLKMNF